jgi:hypothetical protein
MLELKEIKVLAEPPEVLKAIRATKGTLASREIRARRD